MESTDFIDGLRIPIIILGYAPQKLFSVGDQNNRGMIPIFSNAEYARNYLQYYRDTMKLDLFTYMIDSYEKGIELFEAVMISDPTSTHIIIDPMPPTIRNKGDKVMCYELSEYIQKFRQCKHRADEERRKKR